MTISSDLVLSSFESFMFRDHLLKAVEESGINFLVIANLIYLKYA
jgi:hypothetical protein